MNSQFIILIIILLLSSCADEVLLQEQCKDVTSPDYLVLCEGMYGYDNATLWGIKEGQSVELFSCRNNRRLGDTANEILAVNDSTSIILVSTSNEIIKINREGKLIASFQLRGSGHFLKQACILNDSVIAMTDLYADKVYTINHYTMRFDSLPIKGLCAPDGIAIGNSTIAICNSGYGIFRKNEQFASTVAFHDLNTGSTIHRATGINPQYIAFLKEHNQWLIQFSHLNTEPDSLGGMQVFDGTYNLVREIRGKFIGKPITVNSLLHCLNGNMVVSYSPNLDVLDTVLVNQTRDQWYRIGSIRNVMYICNARNYTLPGSIQFYDAKYQVIGSKYVVGINPSTVVSLR